MSVGLNCSVKVKQLTSDRHHGIVHIAHRRLCHILLILNFPSQ